MPNHIMNIVTIRGNKESISKFVQENVNVYAREDGEVAPFSFETIIPRPKSLDIESSTRVDDAMKFVSATDDEKVTMIERYGLNTTEKLNEFEELGKTAINNVKEYGFKDWYDWDIHNWGTKWDCYYVSVDYDDTSVSIVFQTAWSTPLPIFQTIAKKYSDLSVYVEFADEDFGCNCGILEFRNGENTLFKDMDGDANFAYNLWGYDAEDFEED